MATLTNPVEEQNVVNRFADYVPPAANTGISYGTNSIPPNGMFQEKLGVGPAHPGSPRKRFSTAFLP